MPDKYKPAQLPSNAASAIAMAVEREEWAKEAFNRDQLGSCREFELTAKLLRAYAEQHQNEESKNA